RNFRYENLSGGEKAVFDLLLDVHVAVAELGTPLVCLDEPELHLNPAVQAAVLTELLGLLPAGSQMWIATHSVGMIRRAFEISTEEPDRVAFLDFGQVEGPVPDVRLEPIQPSRQLVRNAMTVALDDLAGLLAPEVLIICEGAQESDRVHVWDERVYRQIFRDLYQEVEFKSSGGKTELDQAAAIAAVLAPGTRVLKLRDRDDLTSEHRERLLAEDPDLRVLKRRSLESYLLDDEVLEALVSDRGSRHGDSLDQLKTARNEALRRNGSAKGSLGAVYETAKRVLGNIEQLGENASEFSAEVLAALITPEMAVREELIAVLNLNPS
ncbi:MAG: AAA family ATPase, partial [Acidimicrobiaceae bacterium]|nr:AAA family ATPase [Acidimicrobiaceae bacterium]